MKSATAASVSCARSSQPGLSLTNNNGIIPPVDPTKSYNALEHTYVEVLEEVGSWRHTHNYNIKRTCIRHNKYNNTLTESIISLAIPLAFSSHCNSASNIDWWELNCCLCFYTISTYRILRSRLNKWKFLDQFTNTMQIIVNKVKVCINAPTQNKRSCSRLTWHSMIDERTWHWHQIPMNF